MKTIRAYATAAAAVVLVASLLAVFALAPSGSTQAAPSFAPTPVAAVQRSPSPEFPAFFNAKVLTADTRSSCFEVPDYAVVDLQYTVDQTLVDLAPNTTTLTLQWSNDNVSYVNGLAVATNNITDTTDLQQYQLFGRYACVYADVTNTNPVTFTVLGVVK
jgi:hypothetical protein